MLVKVMITFLVVIAILIAVAFSRSQSLRRFALFEIVVVAVIAGSICLSYFYIRDYVSEQYLGSYRVYMARTYEYIQAIELRDSVADLNEAVRELDEVLYAILPDSEEGTDVKYLGASVVHYDEEGYREMFHAGPGGAFEQNRESALNLLSAAASGEGITSGISARGTGLVAVVDTTRIAPRSGLLVEISMSPAGRRSEEISTGYIYRAGMLFLVGTLLVILIVFFQDRQMRRILKVLTDVAVGKTCWNDAKNDRKIFEVSEMRALRNSLTHLLNDNQRNDYYNVQVLKAYYRFAPKDIEKILCRPSIMDVEINDHATTEGILALVDCNVNSNLTTEEQLAAVSRQFKEVNDTLQEQGGIYLSGNADLSELNVFFNKESSRAVQFGLNLLDSVGNGSRGGMFVLLHKTMLNFGVAGNEVQASPYILSREMNVLGKYTDKLKGLNIGMAVTDGVYELIEKDVSARYIGFLSEGRYIFKIYEILDVYSVKERQRRMDTLERFREALNLLYQDDFYLARNAFTDVLKESPSDEVARWYLFLCERRLNSSKPGNVSYGLFSEE